MKRVVAGELRVGYWMINAWLFKHFNNQLRKMVETKKRNRKNFIKK